MGRKKQSRLVRSANQEGKNTCTHAGRHRKSKKKLDLECGRRGARHKIGGEWSVRVDRGGFGHEISAIEEARNETFTKQILTCTITDPVKTRVDALRDFGGDGRVRQANPRLDRTARSSPPT